MALLRRAAVVFVLCLIAYAAIVAGGDQDEIVAFNQKSSKYHCLKCSAARRCTRNCVEIKRSEAKARGGVACKLCGGTCGT